MKNIQGRERERQAEKQLYLQMDHHYRALGELTQNLMTLAMTLTEVQLRIKKVFERINEDW